ncbi:protein PHLOEM PROTEIN 2-LIKE A9-like isoform X3 [Salvia hispanica]|uniref:protein PHLOEM PROTEIN 2-LIKE A9-like isoform X3 n=1 Tax=Salvia hispanica TaxID=49212 RepID=UPI00200949E6|nr:protein PHLOEM PROTEIN 2-LIKE A9-like isoform X3 [Salvia hispanica]
MASNTTPHHSGNSSLKFTKGAQGMKIYPRNFNIVWGNDTRYWNVPKNTDLAAELCQVSWLEVTGGVVGTKAGKSYEVGFSVSLNPDAFGWGKYPIYIMIKRGNEEKATWTKIMINPNQKGQFEIKGRLTRGSDHQIEGSDDGKLSFGLYEVWSGKWKGGLKIHHAYVKEC